MISYDNVKIMVIDTREGEYNYKKKKYIKFKTPKLTKKTVFDDNCYDLGDLFTAIKFQCDRTLGTNDEIEVSFKVNQEF